MDHPESWPQPSGLTAEGASLFATAFASAAKKDDDWWARAEHQTAELITSIQPIHLSEERRKAIANFVERLIKGCLIKGCLLDCFVQVETFGSVPLKTYLPDGDIDLTVLSVHTDLKETWAQDVLKALKRAEEDADAEFRVKEVQYIQAEVKIIKCLVENIVVDISFNQTGGLCTFFFLEEVDRYIGLNHLFKRSIILVKAWCYYESRILGAHHGLISTYALETLVLYIFHVFHSSLQGPLEVLYTFLVYFSNFDWDKYCVSLWGPLPLALITQRMSADFAEPPRSDGGRLLLTQEFLEGCVKEYSGVSTGQDSNNQRRYFNTKYLNVLDPIRDTNNLGRSVNVGSFKRIRSAFGLGARTLGEVLECSPDQINERFKSFFSCTFKSLERYRSGGRPDTASENNTKQERVRATTEASLVQPVSNVVNPEGQWRQVGGGKGRYEGDIARVQTIKGSNHYYFPQEHFERSIPVNRRSCEDHDHANIHPLFRPGESNQSRAPIQDSSSPLWGPSRGDVVGQGAGSRSRNNIPDLSTLSLSNHDMGRPPGPSGDFKTNFNHGNFNRKLPPPGDENDTSTSGRKVEQRKGHHHHSQWSIPQHRVYTSPDDVSNHGQDSGSSSQSIVRPFSSPKYIPPYLQVPSHGNYQAQMPQLPVSTAMPVPAGPRILPSALPATTSSLMGVSVAPSGEGASSSHKSGFSRRGEEHWRSPLEDPKQPLHRVTSNPSPDRAFPIGSTSLSENCPSPFPAAPPVLPGKFNPSPPLGEFPQAYGPTEESLSCLSMRGDERPGEVASPQLDEEAENRPPSSDMKASGGHHSSSDEQRELEVVRSVDGHAAELRRHWLTQPSLQETSLGGRQQGTASLLEVPASFPSPLIQAMISCQSVVVQAPIQQQAGAGTDLIAVLPSAVGVPVHPPLVIEHASGPSFRTRPMETASSLHVIMQSPQLMCYSPSSLHMPAYSPYFVMPTTGTDGVIRGGDSMGDLHSNGSIDFGSNLRLGPQSRTNPQRHTHVSRERPGLGGRGGNQHGSYGYQDRNNPEESNQSHAPRYRSSGQGQGQQNKHEPRAQAMKSSLSSPSTSQTASTGVHIASSNGYPGVGIPNAPPVIMQQLASDANTGFSPELEFGSLGPFQPG